MASAGCATGAELYLGLQETGTNSGDITPVAQASADQGVSYNSEYGTFSINNISAFDQTGYDLSSTGSSTAGEGATEGQTLYVWISERDLTTATNAEQSVFKSTLTENTLPTGWSVTEFDLHQLQRLAVGNRKPAGVEYVQRTGQRLAEQRPSHLRTLFGYRRICDHDRRARQLWQQRRAHDNRPQDNHSRHSGALHMGDAAPRLRRTRLRG